MNSKPGLRMQGIIVAFLLLVASGLAHAQSPPTAPSLAYGTYTVGVPLQGAVTMLQEKVGANGTWTTIYSVGVQYPGGTSTLSFTKPPGTYSYRTYVMYTSYYGGTYGIYSSEITVQVQSGPAPTQDLMTNQLGYTYEVRIGDLTGDGLADVLVRRTAGGVSGNGTLENALLRRQTDGAFTALVATPTQVATAIAQYPASSTAIELKDMDMDGYVDVRLPGLGNAISGAVGQIVFSAGTPGSIGVRSVVAMGAKYNKFMTDSETWIDDPDYFVNHAQIYYQPIYGYIYTCDYYYTDNGYQYLCYLSSGIIGYQAYYDFSPWDPDAVSMRYAFNKTQSGDHAPGVIPGSNEGVTVDQAFRNVFAMPWMRGVLKSNCYDYQYDPNTGLPCIEYDLLGTLTFATLRTEKRGCRLLTWNEKQVVVDERIFINDVDKVSVCRRRYLGAFVATIFTVRGANMSPDGNVYVAPKPPGFLDWREDYTQPPSDPIEFSDLLHELGHVFQVRNGHVDVPNMFKKEMAAISGAGYKYWPAIQTNQLFWTYNIEQQAQMIQDRFLFRHGYSTRVNSVGVYLNQGATKAALEAVVPDPLAGNVTLQ